MENFNYYNPTRIIFGKGTENTVGNEVSRYGKKILLHYGRNNIKQSGLYDKVVSSLKKAHIDFIELPGVMPNPRLSLIREGIKICRNNEIDFILAVGGGSVIDSAKSIAIGVPYEGDIWDFFTSDKLADKALGIGTILTIPATGSESSPAAVITNEDGWFKRSSRSDLMYPKFSILNPELAFTLPKYQIACGISDILSHLMERYFTPTKNVELTDRLIEGAMKTVINIGPKLIKDYTSYDTWAEIMWTGTVAHNEILNTGRIGDWASHRIEHELSGIYDIAHGAGLAIIFPAWMKYVYNHDRARFLQFATRVWDIPKSSDTEKAINLGIEKLTGFLRELNLPVTLKEIGINRDKFEEMAEKCINKNNRAVGNFLKLDVKSVIKIFDLARPF
jgi:alcohol dehydrogenase YqhD (iron-dependent ADH family)